MSVTPQGYVLDVIPSRRDPRDFTYAMHRPDIAAAPVPPTDAVPGFWTAPVLDQGMLNGCVANASANARAMVLPAYVPLSRLFLWWIARNMERTVGQNVGVSLADGCAALLHWGVPPEVEEPYDPAQFNAEPTAQDLADALAYRIRAYFRQSSPDDVRRAIHFGHPVLLGFMVTPSFENAPANGLIAPPSPGEPVLGGHCVVLGAYDDDATGTTFHGLNSWGTGWANGGRFSIGGDYLMRSDVVFDMFSLSA